MAQPESSPTVRLMLGGDVMLGRLVAQAIRRYGPAYPLAGVAGIMRRADLTLVNLECAITGSTAQWGGAPKAFYFAAPPEGVQALTFAGVDGVTLANNHVLDFEAAGLNDTLRILNEHGIGHAGAGAGIGEACEPVFFERRGIRFGMVAWCDHQADFAATERGPGIAWLDLSDEAAALAQFRRGLSHILQGGADWPILSLHWGPNRVERPSDAFRRLAHAAIDMGYRILFGHSAHVFQGVEVYRGCPILYAAGDLVDDYYVDPWFGNDHQLLFELALSQDALMHIELHPVFIEDCRVIPAVTGQFEFIAERAARLCAELGTRVERRDGRLWIACGAQETEFPPRES